MQTRETLFFFFVNKKKGEVKGDNRVTYSLSYKSKPQRLFTDFFESVRHYEPFQFQLESLLD